ncbi:MAG: invasion associated locus B family protein [Stellaceae bacterium]
MVNATLRALLIGGALMITFASTGAQPPPPVAPSMPAAAVPAARPIAAPGGTKSEHLGDADGWSAFAETDKNAKACFLVGRPVKSEPDNLKRGDVYVYVTHRPAEKTFNVVSFAAGYPYKDGSDADLAVDTHKFALFTTKESAWSRDAATDKAVVDAMAKAKQAVLKGTSARGTNTTDTYSLDGFAAMLTQIDKACGVKR